MIQADKRLKLASGTKLVIGPRQVARIMAEPGSEEPSLSIGVGEGAGVHLVMFGLAPKFTLQAEVASKAQFTFTLAGESGQDNAAELSISLLGRDSNVHVQVAALVLGQAVSRCDCRLEHVAPGALGRVVARRIVQDDAHSAFQGMLKVAAGAQNTDTYLSDKALLMGQKARAASDPQLEILADDVRASHGATIGRLDNDELFYLRSRGIGEHAAARMLLRAFLAPALVGVPNDVISRFVSLA